MKHRCVQPAISRHGKDGRRNAYATMSLQRSSGWSDPGCSRDPAYLVLSFATPAGLSNALARRIDRDARACAIDAVSLTDGELERSRTGACGLSFRAGSS